MRYSRSMSQNILAATVVLSVLLITAGCGDVASSPTTPTPPSIGLSTSSASVVASETSKRVEKVAICHRNHGASEFTALSIAAAALTAHLAHGDARAGDPVPGRPGAIFAADCTISAPARVTITFGGLTVDGAQFSAHTESGFTVAATGPSSFSRDWRVANLVGNPAPSIQFRVGPGSPQTSAAIRISADGGMFRLASIDLYSSVTPIPYELQGFMNFTPVFTATGTVPNTFGTFRTVLNPYGDVLVDSVIVVLTNPAMPECCGNPMGLDNIVLVQ